MKCSRWIATCVDLLDHPVVGMAVPPPKPADPSKHAQQPTMAWLDLIASAAWKEKEISHKGKVVKLKRGEFLAGRAYWAARWNWGEKSVRSFFSKLVEYAMIAFSGQSEGHYANVASVCNYSKYQSKASAEKPDERPEPGQSRASGGPVVGQTVQGTTKVTITTNSETNNVVPIKIAEVVVCATTEEIFASLLKWQNMPRANSAVWLSSFVKEFGQEIVEASYHATIRALAQKQMIAQPIRYWSQTANNMKRDAAKPAATVASPTMAALERRKAAKLAQGEAAHG